MELVDNVVTMARGKARVQAPAGDILASLNPQARYKVGTSPLCIERARDRTLYDVSVDVLSV